MRLALHWQILVAMVLGAGIGLLLNGTVSTVDHSVTGKDLPSDAQAVDVVGLQFKDSTDRIEIVVKSADGSEQQFIVDGKKNKAGSRGFCHAQGSEGQATPGV